MEIFENVANLVASKLKAGTIVETKGYHTAGDGGGAKYLIQTSGDYGSTPDGYGDHAVANGNVAVLQHSGEVNVKQFGAKGDGVTDDSSAIQAALDQADSGGVVVLPAGDFVVTPESTSIRYCLIVNGSDIEVRGAGREKTTIKTFPTDYRTSGSMSGELKAAIALGVSIDNAGVSQSGLLFRDFTIDGGKDSFNNWSPPTTFIERHKAFDMRAVTNNNLEGVTFYRVGVKNMFREGMYSARADSNESPHIVRECVFSNTFGSQGNIAGRTHYYDCFFDVGYAYAIEHGGQGLIVEGCTFNAPPVTSLAGNTKYVSFFAKNDPTTDDPNYDINQILTSYCVIRDNTFNEMENSVAFGMGVQAKECYSLLIENNVFNCAFGSGAASVSLSFQIVNADIKGNTFVSEAGFPRHIISTAQSTLKSLKVRDNAVVPRLESQVAGEASTAGFLNDGNVFTVAPNVGVVIADNYQYGTEKFTDLAGVTSRIQFASGAGLPQACETSLFYDLVVDGGGVANVTISIRKQGDAVIQDVITLTLNDLGAGCVKIQPYRVNSTTLFQKYDLWVESDVAVTGKLRLK